MRPFGPLFLRVVKVTTETGVAIDDLGARLTTGDGDIRTSLMLVGEEGFVKVKNSKTCSRA